MIIGLTENLARLSWSDWLPEELLLLLLGLVVLGMSADVLQGLENSSWDWWWGWQYGTLGLVTVLIGQVGNLDQFTFRRVPREATVGLVTTLSLFLGSDAVGGFVSEAVSTLWGDIKILLVDHCVVILGSGVGASNECRGDKHL